MAHEDQDLEALKASAAQAERLHHFSHGVKNRLAGMLEVARLLGTTNDAGQEAELRTFFEEQFFKALREMELLLDDLSVERGVGRLSLSPADLAPMITTAVQDAAFRTDRKQQTVTVEGNITQQVSCDPHYLLQALQALLSNASKFGPEKSAIRVFVEEQGDSVMVKVSDPGVGLTGADVEQVFDRYALLSSLSTAGEAQGRSTLARVRQWMLAMGGDVRAESPGPGHGSTFTLIIKRA